MIKKHGMYLSAKILELESVPKICPGFLKRGLLAIMDVKRTGLLELGFIFAERL